MFNPELKNPTEGAQREVYFTVAKNECGGWYIFPLNFPFNKMAFHHILSSPEELKYPALL
jgi:hypothetical protein